ncbi:bifunctional 4-hydroxy-2-oxoglutarate aldolase/2-dehydro-3-deoxy-phosphogluconate aldolase [Hyphococcus sp. DH-69]|uniref:bifunctional 4-hydroxy-2-oxoglutarate aldolase/2-dehydro-3-deoxy-phosphogluconate aldolase n=1 Tax=Hyphococcus formosus TaxID=3143534 RepID=UPI00398A8BC2
MNIETILSNASVIPVIEIPNLDVVSELVAALTGGGLKVIELTLRTDCALEALSTMKAQAPDLFIGMGTILSEDDVEKSIDAGADFLVTPGASLSLLAALKSAGRPALPGVATVSEAITAIDAGFNALKFFPAEASGGLPVLKAIHAVMPNVSFCPTGGIDAKKATDYLALPNVPCVGGSWIAPKNLIANQDWNAIEHNAKIASALK